MLALLQAALGAATAVEPASVAILSILDVTVPGSPTTLYPPPARRLLRQRANGAPEPGQGRALTGFVPPDTVAVTAQLHLPSTAAANALGLALQSDTILGAAVVTQLQLQAGGSNSTAGPFSQAAATATIASFPAAPPTPSPTATLSGTAVAAPPALTVSTGAAIGLGLGVGLGVAAGSALLLAIAFFALRFVHVAKVTGDTKVAPAPDAADADGTPLAVADAVTAVPVPAPDAALPLQQLQPSSLSSDDVAVAAAAKVKAKSKRKKAAGPTAEASAVADADDPAQAPAVHKAAAVPAAPVISAEALALQVVRLLKRAGDVGSLGAVASALQAALGVVDGPSAEAAAAAAAAAAAPDVDVVAFARGVARNVKRAKKRDLNAVVFELREGLAAALAGGHSAGEGARAAGAAPRAAW